MNNYMNAMFIVGNTGEMHIKNILEQFGCKYYHDIYFKSDDGQVCQVDFVAIVNNAIVVLEVKSYNKCVIVGEADGRIWTACYRNGNKTFYNPLKQNNKHIEIMRNCLHVEDMKIYNIVVFASGSGIRVDNIESKFEDVVDMSDLWYKLIDIQSKTEKKEVSDTVINDLDDFKIRSWELSEEHKRLYFKGR